MDLRATTNVAVILAAGLLASGCDDAPKPAPPVAPPTPAPAVPAAPAAGPEAQPQWKEDGGAIAMIGGEKRGLRVREEGAWDGYTLIAPLNGRTVYLIDMDGQPVHTWTTTHTPAGGAHLLPNGNLLRCARMESAPGVQRGGIGGLTQEIAWDGSVAWSCDLVEQGYTQHHDLHPMANGNVLLVVRKHHTHEDALAHGRDPRGRSTAALWSDLVIEVEPVRPSGGKVVWTWESWDHVVQDHDPKARAYGKIADHPHRLDVNADHRNQPKTETEEKKRRREALEAQMRAVGYAGDDAPQDAPPPTPAAGGSLAGEDWLHLNGIDYLAEHDLIALSARHLSEIFVIDHSPTTAQAATGQGGRFGRGGDLLYRWGNPRSYGLGEAADQRLFLQHDVTWVKGGAPDELRFLVFNNGPRGPGQDFSSVDEIAARFDRVRGFEREPGKRFGPDAPAWSWSNGAHFYSGFISGAQRLPNGNTLICEGAKGHVFEVTPEGRVVWEFWNPWDGEAQGALAPLAALFHATRIAKDHPGLRGKL